MNLHIIMHLDNHKFPIIEASSTDSSYEYQNPLLGSRVIANIKVSFSTEQECTCNVKKESKNHQISIKNFICNEKKCSSPNDHSIPGGFVGDSRVFVEQKKPFRSVLGKLKSPLESVDEIENSNDISVEENQSSEKNHSESLDVSQKGVIPPKLGIDGQEKALSVSNNLIENIISLVSGSCLLYELSSQNELNVLKIFISRVSHRKTSNFTQSQIEKITLENQKSNLKNLAKSVFRHRKNENIRTVITMLHKFLRTRDPSPFSLILDRFQTCRFSQAQIISFCLENKDFHTSLLYALKDPDFTKFCIDQLRQQLKCYLLHWCRYFLRSGKWKARFVSFPVEITQVADFFSIVIHSLK